MDLGATGSNFTWHRNRNGLRIVSKRLDRALSDCSWRMAFPEAGVENLCRLYSDHHPIILRCGGVSSCRGDRPFRFEAFWASHQDFLDVVREAWAQGNHEVIDGLEHVQKEASRFNEEVFGNVFRRKRLLEARIRGIQKKLETVDTLYLCRLERELHNDYNRVLHQEELLWYQKSREKWVR